MIQAWARASSNEVKVENIGKINYIDKIKLFKIVRNILSACQIIFMGLKFYRTSLIYLFRVP